MIERDPLRDALDDLPREILPQRDLWPNIAAELTPAPAWRRHLPTVGLLIAATVAVVLIAGPDRGPAPQIDFTSLNEDYALVRADVLDLMDHRCGQWAPSACDGLRSGLRELDRSAADIRLARLDTPASSPAALRLATSYQRTLEKARDLAGRAARL